MTFVLWLLFKWFVGLADGATLEAAMEPSRTLTLQSERSALIWAQSLSQLCDPSQDTPLL